MDPGDQVIITGGKWEGNAGTFVRPNGSNWVIEIDGEQRYIVPNNIEKIKGKSRIKVERPDPKPFNTEHTDSHEFNVDDEVEVTDGIHRGKVGKFVRRNGANWIISVDGDTLYIKPQNLKKKVTIKAERDTKPIPKPKPETNPKHLDVVSVGVYNVGVLSRVKYTKEYPSEQILGEDLMKCSLIILVEVKTASSWGYLMEGERFESTNRQCKTQDGLGILYDPLIWEFIEGAEAHRNFYTAVLQHKPSMKTCVITCVHLPQSLSKEVKGAWKALRTHLQKLQRNWQQQLPIYIVGGDFNQSSTEEGYFGQIEDFEDEHYVKRVIKDIEEETTAKGNSIDNLLTNAKVNQQPKVIKGHMPWKKFTVKQEDSWHFPITVELELKPQALEKHPNYENSVV